MIRILGAVGLLGLAAVVAGCDGGFGGGSGSGNMNTAPPNQNASGNVNDNGAPDDGANGNDNADGGNVNTNDNSVVDFTLTSQSIVPGGMIGMRFVRNVDCGGDDVSPHLAWSGHPSDTQTFLLIIFDSDAGDFIHWVVFDIPALTLQIQEDGLVPGQQTLNGYAQFGYGAPCPPPGEEHAYVFRVYALDLPVGDIDLTAGQAVTRADVEAAIAGHVIGQAQFTASYSRS